MRVNKKRRQVINVKRILEYIKIAYFIYRVMGRILILDANGNEHKGGIRDNEKNRKYAHVFA